MRIDDIAFANHGKKMRLVSLFVDIRKSTTLVNTLGLEAAGRMYKSYVRAVTKTVNARGGQVLSFNGDGIVAGFVGADAPNAAVLSALNIHWFNLNVLKPKVDLELVMRNAALDLRFDFGIGVDMGEVLVVKAGMAGEDNRDLVWAGNPVNYSVKVASLASSPYCVYVSSDVFDEVHFSLTMVNGQFIWDAWQWAEKNKTLWRTSWWYGADYIKTVPSTPLKSILSTKLALPPPSLADSIAALLNPPSPPSKTGFEALADLLYGKKKL